MLSWFSVLSTVGSDDKAGIQPVKTCTSPSGSAFTSFYYKYTVFQKKEATKLLAITLSNLNRFSKFFHC